MNIILLIRRALGTASSRFFYMNNIFHADDHYDVFKLHSEDINTYLAINNISKVNQAKKEICTRPDRNILCQEIPGKSNVVASKGLAS